MSDFKAQCGRTIHVAQWTSKRKIASVKYCETHKAKPLNAEIAELRKDRERLNWMASASIQQIERILTHSTFGNTAAFRAAIDDAAMAEGKGAE